MSNYIHGAYGKPKGINTTQRIVGKSAYEIAVEHGFVGSEEEWLESLKGKSAYEVAVDLGYEGTADEWVESIGMAMGIDLADELTDLKDDLKPVKKESSLSFNAQILKTAIVASVNYNSLTDTTIYNNLPFEYVGEGIPSQENQYDIAIYQQTLISIDGTQYTTPLIFDEVIAEATIDLLTGEVTIPRFAKVFTGNEALTTTGNTSQNFVYMLDSKYTANNKDGVCTHFQWGTYYYGYSGDAIKVSFGSAGYRERIIFMTPPGQYTASTFKTSVLKQQYDSGTPITVSFELVNPIKYKIDLPFTIQDEDVVTANTGLLQVETVVPVETAVNDALKYSGIDAYLKGFFKVHMTHTGDGRYTPSDTRNAIVSPVRYEFPVSVSVKAGFDYAIQTYDGYETGQTHLINAGPWHTSSDAPTVIESGTYWCIIVRTSNNDPTDNNTHNNLIFDAVANFDDVYSKLMPLVQEGRVIQNYYVDRSFRKIPVHVELLGVVKYLQSWCKYKGYYYSTDGTHICKQDSDFTEISTVDLTVGHGNAFQLGNANLAYISGWNDQNVYVVDMETLTLDSVIALPTTGYTTCAVDEARKLVYIFQRDTYPSLQEEYNFIVYDYDSEQIVSTRKTSVKFAAMQACDLVDDRIIVLSGLGTSAAPDYYRLFDLDGNVIGEFFFPDFSGYEPEGVFIDRDTKEIIIGLNGRNIYKIDYVD